MYKNLLSNKKYNKGEKDNNKHTSDGGYKIVTKTIIFLDRL